MTRSKHFFLAVYREMLVLSLRNLVPNGELALDIVKESLVNEEIRWREHYPSSQNGANVARNNIVEEAKIRIYM